MLENWFAYAQRCFEIFLEMKLELFQEATEPIRTQLLAQQAEAPEEYGEDVKNNTFELGSNLEAAPTEFLDEVHELMYQTYEGLDRGFTIASEEEQGDQDGGLLYGELTPAGVRQLMEIVWPVLRAKSTTATPSGSAPPLCTFVDFGSGTGRLLFEMAHLASLRTFTEAEAEDDTDNNEEEDKEERTPSQGIVQFLGLELSKTRHDIAVEAATRNSVVTFLTFTAEDCKEGQGEEDLPEDLVSLCYANTTFFSPKLPFESAVVAGFACVLGFSKEMTASFLDSVLLRLRRSYQTLTCVVLLLKGVSPLQLPNWEKQGGGARASPPPKKEGGAELAAHPLFWQEDLQEVRWLTLATTWMNEAPAVMLRF